MNLTVAEAALLIGVSPARVRQLIGESRLKATKLGRDWFVTQAEAQRFAGVPRPITGRPPSSTRRAGR